MPRFILILVTMLTYLFSYAEDFSPHSYMVKTIIIGPSFEINSQFGTATHVSLNDYGYKENRYLLTAAHVVGDPSKSNVLICVNDKPVHCEVIKIDPDFDICILKADVDLLDEALEVSKKTPEVGEELEGYGFPKMEGTELHGYYVDVGLLPKARLLNTAIIPKSDSGASGTGLFYQRKLVGIIVANMMDTEHTKTGVVCYLPVRRIVQFLTYKE